MSASRLAVLAALALVLCAAPTEADTVSAAIDSAQSAIAAAKAKLDQQLISACNNLKALTPQCMSNTAQLQALPPAFAIQLNKTIAAKVASVNNCFRSAPATAVANEFVCCLDLTSLAHAALCVPSSTPDASLPDLVAKNVTDTVNDAIKKALAPIGGSATDALSITKDALAAAQQKVDAALAAISD